MSSEFNLIANLQFRMAPGQVAGIYSQLQSAMKPVKLDLGMGNVAQHTQNIKALAAGVQNLQGEVRGINSAAASAANSLSSMNKASLAGVGFLENLATQAGLAARRFLAFSVAAGSIVTLTSSIKENLGQAVAFERQMNRIAQTSGATSSEIKGIEQEITRLATSMGVSGQEMTEVALILKQAGLSLKDTKIALSAVAQANLGPNFGSMTEIVEGLIASSRQFNIQAKDFVSVLGSMSAVAGEFATEGKDLITTIKMSGAAAQQTGTSLNELVALFTSVRSTTRESAESISTALRTIFARLQRNSTVDMLKELQINLRYTKEESQRLAGDDSLTNQFVGAYQAVQRLSEGLKGLPTADPRYAQIVETLGGFRNISKVVPLIQQFGEAQRALTVAQAGAVSVTMQAEKAQESLAVRFAKTREEWHALGRSIVGSNAFQDLAKDALALASGLVKVVEFAKPLVPILAAMAATKLFQGIGPAVKNFGTMFAAPVGAGVSGRKPFARGGVVPGVGNQDSVDASLTPGEFVIKKRSAQRIGYDNLHQLNNGASPAHFAQGGDIRTALRRYASPKINNVAGLVAGLGMTMGGGQEARALEMLLKSRKQNYVEMIHAARQKDDKPRAFAQGGSIRDKIYGSNSSKFKHDFEKPQIRQMGEKLSGVHLQSWDSESLGHYKLEGYHLKQQFTDDERQALRSYSITAHKDLNKGLRSGAVLDGYLERLHSNLSSATSKGRIPQVPLYRGIEEAELEYIRSQLGSKNLDDAVGKTFSMPGYLSTSLSTDIARRFVGSRGAMLKINPKQQQRGAFLNRPTLSTSIREQEVLLPHGSQFQLSGVDDYGMMQLQSFAHGGEVANFASGGSLSKTTLFSPAGMTGNGIGTGRLDKFGDDAMTMEKLEQLFSRKVRSVPKKHRDAYEQYHLGSLFNTFSKGALQHIHKDSNLLGVGSVGWAFGDPKGGVVRLQSMQGIDYAMENHPNRKNLQRSVFSPLRPKVDGVLQALDSKRVRDYGGTFLEKLPYASNVPLIESNSVIERLRKKLDASGYEFSDRHLGNIGRVGGDDFVIDPGAVRKFAGGGLLGGSGDKDSIPAMVMPGEYILRKEAVQSLGQARLHQMNAFGKVPHFAEGGPVQRFAHGDKVIKTTYGQLEGSELGDKVKQLLTSIGQDVFKFTEVLVKIAKKTGVMTLEVNKKQISSGVYDPKMSESEGAKKHGLGEAKLPHSAREQLVRNTPGLPKYIASRFGYNKRDGGDGEAAQAASAYQWQATRNFDPAKISPGLAKLAQEGKWDDPDMKKAYAAYIVKTTNTHLKRESEKRDKQKPTGEAFFSETQSREAAPDDFDLKQRELDRALQQSTAQGRDAPAAKKGDMKALLERRRRKSKGLPEFSTALTRNPGGAITVPPSANGGGDGSPPDEPIDVDFEVKMNRGRLLTDGNAEFRRTLQERQRYPNKVNEEREAKTRARFAKKGIVNSVDRPPIEGYMDSDLGALAYQEQVMSSLSASHPAYQFIKKYGMEKGLEEFRRRQIKRTYKQSTEHQPYTTDASRGIDSVVNANASRPFPAKQHHQMMVYGIMNERDPYVKPWTAEQHYQDNALAGFDPSNTTEAQRTRAARAAARSGVDPLTIPLKDRYQISSGGLTLSDPANPIVQKYREKKRTENFAQYGQAGSTIAQFNDDGHLVGGDLRMSVDTEVKQRTARAGGRVSQRTQDAFESDAIAQQMTKTKTEMLAAERQILKLLLPRVSQQERNLIAEENVEKALRGEAQVIKSKTGAILGTAGSVNQATAMGISAPGMGLFGRMDAGFHNLQSGVGGRIANSFIGRGASSLGRGIRNVNESLSGVTNTLLSPAMMMTLPYATMLTDNAAGEAETAVRGGAAGAANFSRFKGASGGIQGALVGAQLGSVLGPLGAVAGGAIGGITGFALAAKDAEKQIREVKIGQALTEFASGLQSAVSLLSSERPTDTGSLIRVHQSMEHMDRETSAKNVADSTGFFRRFDSNQFMALQNRSARDNYAPQLPGMTQLLSNEARRLGRNNTSDESVDRLVERLRSGNGGINNRLITNISRARGVSSDDIMRELRRDIEAGHRQGQTERENLRGRSSDERSSSAWSRLALSAISASDGITRLREQSRVLGDAFEGISGSVHVSSYSERLGGIGRSDNAFLQPLAMIRDLGGESGQSMYSAATAVNDIARVLPSVLANAASRNFVEGPDLTTGVQADLARALGYTMENLPQHLREELNVVVRNLNHLMDGGRGVGGFTDEYKSDPSKLTEKLTAGRVDAVRGPASQMLRELETNSNAFIDGLGRISRATNAIGEQLDRSSLLSAQGSRVNLDIWADRNGQSDRALDFTNLAAMEAPFQSRQERLTGFRGDQANDPNAVGGLLASLRRQIVGAEGQQAEAFQNINQSGGRERFEQAADALRILRDRAANLQQALQHLGDAAQRNAAAQERLSHLTRERDARRGFGEQWFRADAEGRSHITRSALMADHAVRAGTLDGMMPEQQSQIIQFLRSVGTATLNIGGQRVSGNNAANTLIDNSERGAFGLDHGQKDEMTSLQNTIAERFTVAENAMTKFVADMTTQKDALMTGIGQQHKDFFTKLSQFFLVEQRIRAQTRQADVGSQRGELARFGEHRQVLAENGISNDEQLQGLIRNRSRFEELAALQTQRAGLRSRETRMGIAPGAWSGTVGSIGYRHGLLGDGGGNSVALTPDQLTGLQDHLVSNQATPDQANRIIQQFQERLTQVARVPGHARNHVTTDDGAFTGEFLSSTLTHLIRRNMGHGEESDRLGRQISTLEGQLGQQVPGVPIGTLSTALGSPTGNRIMAAANAFGNQTGPDRVTFGNLDDRIRATSDSFRLLTETIDRLKAAITPAAGAAGPGPAPFATGGFVGFSQGGIPGKDFFKPKGTDTVPAMLTPNEFVVNAASAQANAALLRRINGARGPIYRSEGGSTPNGQDWQQMLREQRERNGLPPLVAREGEMNWQQMLGQQQDRPQALRPDGFPVNREFVAGPLSGRPLVPARPVAPAESQLPWQDMLRQQRERQHLPPLAPREGELNWRQMLDEQREREQHDQVLPRPRPRPTGVFGDRVFGPLNPRPVTPPPAPVDPNVLRLRMFAAQNPFGEAAVHLAQGNPLRMYRGVQRGEQAILAQQQRLANTRNHNADFSSQANIGQANISLRGRGNSLAAQHNYEYSSFRQTFFGDRNNLRLRGFASGGIVPGHGNTDSQPAVLTPGEGVLNLRAMGRLGANGLQMLNSGGVVGASTSTGSSGGLSLPPESQAAINSFATSANQLGLGLRAFSESALTMRTALNSFAGHATTLSDAISKMPRQMTHDHTHQVNVTLNGADALSRMMPAIEQMVLETTRTEMNRVFSTQMPEAGLTA